MSGKRVLYDKYAPPRIARTSQLKTRSGNGKLNEDLGNDFAGNRIRPSRPPKPESDPTLSCVNPRKTVELNNKIKHPPVKINTDDSIDDLDCLSQTSSHSLSTEFRSESSATCLSLDSSQDPRYPTPKSPDFSKLKFKKLKPSNSGPRSRKTVSNPGNNESLLIPTPPVLSSLKARDTYSASQSSVASKITTQASKHSGSGPSCTHDSNPSQSILRVHCNEDVRTTITDSADSHSKRSLAQFPNLSPIRQKPTGQVVHHTSSVFRGSPSSPSSSTSVDSLKNYEKSSKHSKALYKQDLLNGILSDEEDVTEISSTSAPKSRKASYRSMKQARTNHAKLKDSNRPGKSREIAPFPMLPQEFESVGKPSTLMDKHTDSRNNREQDAT
jgi:hypothetical protein